MHFPRKRILTHRGLEPSRRNFYPESSYEAFEDHLSRGFGIEFDPNFVKDGVVVSHDYNTKRITHGRIDKNFADMNVDEISNIRYGTDLVGRLAMLDEILKLIRKYDPPACAMHVKGGYQNSINMDILAEHLKRYQDIVPHLVLFDLKPEFSRRLRRSISGLNTAPSVAHPYDIERYNAATKNTLYTAEQALELKDCFNWVWLDEWDTANKSGKKRLYTQETFSTLRDAGYKIALVTPELHASSPGLLGGEAHEDARDKETLFKRIREILLLKPDAVCTDYPEEVAGFELPD